MALARSGSSDYPINGIMGIGFREGEAANYPLLAPTIPFTYPTVLDNMLQQGFIRSRSYSLWLDNLWNNTGVILFGGVDTEKYTGPLVSLPVQPNPVTSRRDAAFVTWSGLAINRGTSLQVSSTHDASPAAPQPALLDSGATVTYLPDDVADAVYACVGAEEGSSDLPIVPCSIDKDYTFNFTFGSQSEASIMVSIYELLVPHPWDADKCLFLIKKAGQKHAVFGDSLLRSAYVVYDLDNYQIALAQTDFKATATADGDEIVPISGPSIPGAVMPTPRPSGRNKPSSATGAGTTFEASQLSSIIIAVMILTWLTVM